MGRASRGRAARRQTRVERLGTALSERSPAPQPSVKRLNRSVSSTLHDGHRAWGLQAGQPSAPSRRPPDRTAPGRALPALGRLEQLTRARAEIDAAIAEGSAPSSRSAPTGAASGVLSGSPVRLPVSGTDRATLSDNAGCRPRRDQCVVRAGLQMILGSVK